jgi:hypothetical protein
MKKVIIQEKGPASGKGGSTKGRGATAPIKK